MSEENALPQSAIGDDGFLKTDPPGETPPVSEPPKKRGPGRPSKDEKLRSESPGAAPKTAAKPQKRGPKMSSEAVGVLSKQIQGLHAMAAMMTGLGLLQISEQESSLLAGGISAVAEEYGLSLDGKTGAALQLFGACAMVYAPRIIAIQQAKAKAAANVVDANVMQ